MSLRHFCVRLQRHAGARSEAVESRSSSRSAPYISPDPSLTGFTHHRQSSCSVSLFSPDPAFRSPLVRSHLRPGRSATPFLINSPHLIGASSPGDCRCLQLVSLPVFFREMRPQSYVHWRHMEGRVVTFLWLDKVFILDVYKVGKVHEHYHFLPNTWTALKLF